MFDKRNQPDRNVLFRIQMHVAALFDENKQFL